jgi:ketosteroid isomerase-like protein
MTLQELEKQLKETKDTLKRLESRVRVTEDIQAIHELQRRYVNALIRTDWDDAVDCFADDAKIDVYLHKPTSGKAAIEKWFKEELSKTHAGKEGDICIHPIISVDGDRAKGSWLLYMMYFYPRTGQSLFWVQGFYNMEYVRERGEWKIRYMNWRERLGLPGGGPPEGLW